MSILGRIFGKKEGEDYTREELSGLGYRTDGRGTGGKVEKGKQGHLMKSTKLTLDTLDTSIEDPYEVQKKSANNILELFETESAQERKKTYNYKK